MDVLDQALSYEWGSAERLRKISVDGGHMILRENLWLFLEMFRAQDRNDSLLWIDQICIDQQNDFERAHQVKLMGKVYSASIRTIVWLGPSEGVETSGIRVAWERHGSLLTVNRDWHVGMPTGGYSARDIAVRECVFAEDVCFDDKCAMCNLVPEWDQTKMMNFRHMLNWKLPRPDNTLVRERPRADHRKLWDLSYWTRLWIVQENVLARDSILFIGMHQYLRAEIRRYCELQIFIASACGRPWDAYTEHHIFSLMSPVDSATILTLERVISLYAGGRTACSVPHDVVYGLLGLVSPACRISVDYQLTAPEVGDLLMDSITLSPTLVETLSLRRGNALGDNLVNVVERLGLTALWDRWLHSDYQTEPLGSRVSSFIWCLGYLERMNFRKQRWTGAELRAIVQTARQIEHTLLPAWNLRGADIDTQLELRDSRKLAAFIEKLNAAAGLDLPRLLSNMTTTMEERNPEEHFRRWRKTFLHAQLAELF